MLQLKTFKKLYVNILKSMKKTSRNKAWFTMPGIVADDLEGIIEPPVKESIVRQGIN